MACDAGLGRAGLLAVLVFLGCTTGDDLATDPGGDGVPDPTLEVLGQHAIRLHWEPAPSMTLRLERRVNLQGDFSAMAGDLPRTQTSLIDDGLEPNTFYGYRLAGYDAFGKRVGTSTVAGGQTAPPPGIDLTITTEPVDPPAVDSDGYVLTFAGPADTTHMPVDVRSHQLFSPLAPGAYRLTLDGLAQQCAPADSLTRDVNVTDQGTQTVQIISIAVQCRDPERGRATATIVARGDLPDADGFDVVIDGIAADDTLSDSLRAYHQSAHLTGDGGSAAFESIRPGRYAFTVDGLAANCTLTGPQGETFDLAALGDVRKAFEVDCEDPDAANRPFELRSTWIPAEAPSGRAVALEVAVDLSAHAGQDLVAFAIESQLADSVLHYDSTTALDIPTVVGNQPLPNLVLTSGFTTDAGPQGVVRLARIWFTVVGDDRWSVRTGTKHHDMVGISGTPLDSAIRTVEATFTVGAGGGGGGGGGGTNQAPHASANGPYTGTAGTPVAFSASGSSDPDGTIASYAWDFGDGGTGTGASPTHAYASAGSYTVTLTVTDNGGLSASATAQVTVAPSGGGGGGGGGGCGTGTTAQPFVLCSAWSPTSAAAGDKVLLTQTIDLTSDAAQDLVAFESAVQTDPALVRFDSARAGGITTLVVNSSTPGSVRMGGFLTGSSGPKGLVTIAKVYYTVLGTSGTVTPQTTFSNFVGTSLTIIDGKITASNGTLTIGSGSGGPVGGGGSGGDTGGGGSGGSGSGGGGGTGGGTSSLDWQSSFGPVDPVTRFVPLNLTLDLRSDPTVSLSAWQVSELSWDPAVLSYASTDFAGGSGIIDATDALAGRLRLSGRPAATANTGFVTVAVVRLVAYGAAGTTSAAHVQLGAVTGRASGADVDLLPRVVVRDGAFITP